ncbi:tRNA lysidine(34) synthetase TilS [Mycoplasma sp. ATU-Cv-703]|uniref:tRNA lysidine(34) synthetase TilS n=1 Tax=Mycoplasma sp. ATU-Cv-703 TaxID=2498595 RepID=UPI000FDF39E2
MKVLAISGGPDSIFLLHKYRRQKVVVAHVNYQLRKTSDADQSLVESYCRRYQIECHVLRAKKINGTGNLQAKARQIRYDFFQKIYQRYQAKMLLTAHHKDDFLETALWHQKTKRQPDYFGMRKDHQIQGMRVKRPFLHRYWKDQIRVYLTKRGLEFASDLTNDDPRFARNRIRVKLAELPTKQKQAYYRWFCLSNQILVKKNRKVARLFKHWQKTGFRIAFLERQTFQAALVWKLIYQNASPIKVSSQKLDNITQFCLSKTHAQKFVLDNHWHLVKKSGRLSLVRVEKDQQNSNRQN